mmetsp:Transcript_29541/g.36201  ORF Transcript_29541/g.36201 Transcript_29541/m.36201 type:complete len:249 (+) Transcript_29541:27-773(+)
MANERKIPNYGSLITKILSENVDKNNAFGNSAILCKYNSKKIDLMEQKRIELKNQRKKAFQRKEILNLNHEIPLQNNNIINEKILKNIATKGVVTLFNALVKHQNSIKKSLGNIDNDKDILNKKAMNLEDKNTQNLLDSLKNDYKKTKLIKINNNNDIHSNNSNNSSNNSTQKRKHRNKRKRNKKHKKNRTTIIYDDISDHLIHNPLPSEVSVNDEQPMISRHKSKKSIELLEHIRGNSFFLSELNDI